MACHFRLAAAGCKIGLPEIERGFPPAWGGTVRLSVPTHRLRVRLAINNSTADVSVAARAKTVGKPAALDMALRGKLLDADEAERIGLIHQACATVEELEEATLELAVELGGKAPLAMQGVLQAIMEGSVRSPPPTHPFRRKSWRLF
eukprot:COSAG04_NODE_301_length_17421_cov_23.392045_7_plen_147_part_00